MGGRVGGQRKCVRGRGGSVGGKTNVVLEKEGNTKDLSGEVIRIHLEFLKKKSS